MDLQNEKKNGRSGVGGEMLSFFHTWLHLEEASSLMNIVVRKWCSRLGTAKGFLLFYLFCLILYWMDFLPPLHSLTFFFFNVNKTFSLSLLGIMDTVLPTMEVFCESFFFFLPAFRALGSSSSATISSSS